MTAFEIVALVALGLMILLIIAISQKLDNLINILIGNKIDGQKHHEMTEYELSGLVGGFQDAMANALNDLAVRDSLP